MFSNIFLPADLASRTKKFSLVKVSLDNDTFLEFPVGAILQKKKNEDFISPRQNELLNRYVDYKGEEFKQRLFSAYQDFYNYLENEVEIVDLLPGKRNNVTEYFFRVLDLLDYEDIKTFLDEVVGIVPPRSLKTEFDNQDHVDGVCSKEQTFLKEDYKHLATLIVIVKATYFLLGFYFSKIGTTMSMSSRDYMLFKFYQRRDSLFYSPGMVKLLQFTEKLIETKTKDEVEKNIRIIDKVVSEDEISILSLAQIVFQKLVIADVVNDTSEVNIVTMLYTFLTNKLREIKNTSKIREKILASGGDSEIDIDSNVENHRAVQVVMQSDIAHINFATDTMDKILVQVSEEMAAIMKKPLVIGSKTYTLEDLRKEFDAYKEESIPENVFRILECVFKGVLDPRALEHLELENIICMITLAFAYIWNLGLPKLAVFLGSTAIRREENFITINVSSGKTRIDKEIMMELIKFFPSTKSISKTSPGDYKEDDVYEIKRWIESFGNDFYKSDWYFILSKEMADELEIENMNVSVTEDMKVLLAQFLIENEKVVYRKSLTIEELVKLRPRVKGE